MLPVAYQPPRREDSLAELAIFMGSNFRPKWYVNENPPAVACRGFSECFKSQCPDP